MSTTVNQYIMLGVRMDFVEAERLIESMHGALAEAVKETYGDNGYQKDIGCFEGMTYISDGMDGKYAFFGIIQHKAEVDQWVETYTFEKVKPKDIRRIQEKAKVLFGKTFTGLPALQLITHWH